MSLLAIPGMILAGGQSRRMGADKTRELLMGRPLIEHVIEAIGPQVARLWINAPLTYDHAGGLEIVPDTLRGYQGPLAGILAGLTHVRTLVPAATGLVTVAGDTPFLPGDLVQRLVSASRDGTIIVFAAHNGRSHPLAAYWPVSLLDDLEEWLSHQDNRKVMTFIERHEHITVAFPPLASAVGDIDPFFNVNTRQDLAEAEIYAKAIGR